MPLDFGLSQSWKPYPPLIVIDLWPFLCGAKLREFSILTKWPSQTLKTWKMQEFKLLQQIHYSHCGACIIVLSLITGSHAITSLLCLKCRMDIAHLMSSYLICSFIFIVQCVPHGLFTAHYSNPVLNTELLISLGAFLQQSLLLYLAASETWNNLFSQRLNEVRGYCTPTWTDGKQR